MFVQFLLTIKVSVVAKIMQSAYLFMCQAQKIAISRYFFNLISNSW